MKRNKKLISIIMTLALLATLLVPVGGAFAADPATKVVSAVASVTTGDQKNLGYIEISDGTQIPAAADTVQVSIELPSGVKWDSNKLAANAADLANFIKTTAGGAIGSLAFVEHNSSTLTFNITGPITVAGNGVKVDLDYVNGGNTLSSKANVDSSFSGYISAKVTVTVLGGGYQKWTQTSEHVVGNVASAALTATAKTPEILGSAGLAKNAATITIEENKPGVFAAPETVTLTIVSSGVTFNAAPAATGVNTLDDDNAPVLAADKKSVVYTIGASSAGIKGKLNITPVLDVSPAATGDLQIEVSSSNTKLANTILTVAKLGEGEFTIKNESVSDKIGYPGKGAVVVGTIVIEQNFAGAFKTNGNLVFTLTGAKWAAANVNLGVFTAGGKYSDDRSIWYSVGAGAATTTKFNNLPNVIIDADAAPGDLKVTVSGTAGPSGDVTIATIVAAATVTADKPEVLANSLNQAAGNITLTETKNGAFTNAAAFTMKAPNGITFAGTPTVKVNGTKQNVAKVNDSEYNVAAMAASSTIDKVEISDLKYNVDSRFVSSDIALELCGAYLVSANAGSLNTKTIFKVANAVGVSATKRAASFVIGSTDYTVNGNTMTMDVAPFTKDGRTFLPVRYVAQALGVSDANIIWDGVNETVTLLKGDKVVQLKIGSKTLLVNGVSITMDVSAELVSGRTMLPFRSIAQALGATVGWDEATQTVTMDLK
ncbi:MAG: hypothetical protein VR68_04460 [Peptococcaceae bacterium BRH_c4a]|nr:MAG: hypothetical protein VR68_04460 [Peptococcaceae bacterium BRH_c4a]